MPSRYPVYDENEPLYISSFGIERDGMSARWGPGRRTEGILHYVLSGKGVFNGHPVAESQGFYIEPNSFCHYYPDPQCPWNYFWFNCSPEFAARFGKNAVKPDEHGIFDYDFRGRLQPLVEKLFSTTDTMSAVEALSHAFSVLAMHEPKGAVSQGGQYVRRAKSFIESSIGRNISVRDVAEAVSIHDRYLYNLFVRDEGISPKEYILRRKLETAEELLLHTDLPISEIGLAAGFPDLYSFSRLFKRKRGIPPSAFRKSGEIHNTVVDRTEK